MWAKLMNAQIIEWHTDHDQSGGTMVRAADDASGGGWLGTRHGKDRTEQAADRRRGDIHLVEVVTPEHDLLVVNVEAPADPELEAQAPECKDIRALGEDRRSFRRDRVQIDLKPDAESLEHGPQEPPNALTPAHRGKPYILVLNVHRQERHRPINISQAKQLQKPFDQQCQRRLALAPGGVFTHNLVRHFRHAVTIW